MRLHHLRLRGIGPFRDEVALDLTTLGASGLFLLEGPTGSGKSTILDAIVYALYGSVAGSATSADRIRSQFAPPTEASVVDLVFETGSGIYRVRREPGYERAKLKGTGTTWQQPKALLWRVTSPEAIAPLLADAAGAEAGIEPIATRLDEVGREVTRAIGLSREQFTQTVLLPQGEFARFLRARTQDRQAVLTRVFGTELFEDVEKQLEAMRRAAKAQVAEATTTLRAAVARFVEASGATAEQAEAMDADAERLRCAEIAASADVLVRDVEQHSAAADETGRRATALETAAREARDAAREHRRLLLRRAELDALAARLEQTAPEHASMQRRLRRHEAATPVASALTRRDAARGRSAEAGSRRAAAIETARDEAEDLAALAETEDALAALGEAGAQETSRAGELTALVELEEKLPARAEALAARRVEHEQLLTETAGVRETLAARPAERDDLVARLRAAQEAFEDLADARVALAAADDRLAASRAAAERAAEVEQAAAQATAAFEQARAASGIEHDLRVRRTAGLAAELALQLESDQACPVCGATDHPHPAETAADAVSADDVAAAEATRRDADAAAARGAAALDVARSRHETALAQAGGLSVEDASAVRGTAQERVAAATAQGQRAVQLQAGLETHDRETSAQRERVQTLTARAEALATAVDAEASALAADAARIEQARAQQTSVAERREAHRLRARAAGRLREAVLAAGQSAARADELAAEAAEALAAANAALTGHDETAFETEPEVRAAVLDAAERERCTTALRERDIDESRLTEGLAEPGLAELVAEPAAHHEAEEALHAAETHLHEAETAAKAAHAEAGRLTGAARRTATARTALDASITSVTTVRATAGTVVRVADLATGASSDGERIRLSTFVLMRRFEDVVAAANARLALLSGADLELVRDTGARGAQRTGLDLLVIDRRTDQARVPETLSGGETFFVSLALALGLADIVTAEAGGVQMQTLFIDEGFGSLDPERLDAVIEEIGHLADTGRTVGIVSHVAELKTRIPEQIHVRRRDDRTSEVTVTA